MYISQQLTLPFLITWAQAQNAGGSPSSSTTTATSSSTAGVQTITLGDDNKLAFSPDSISADVGSTVEFQFYPPIHSVTQSSFNSPCAPLADGTGFWSGAITTTGHGTNANVFTLTINDTNPIWFYCATIGHCESGMAGVINPPSGGSDTLDQYKSAASKVSSPPTPSVVQGGSFGTPKAASTSTSTSTSSASHSAASSAASTTPTKSAGVKDYNIGGTSKWMYIIFPALVAIGVGSLTI